MPFVHVYYRVSDLYRRLLPVFVRYYSRYAATPEAEKPAQLSTTAAEVKGARELSTTLTIIVTDHYGVPTGVDFKTALATSTAAQELRDSLMSQVASVEILNEDLSSLLSALQFLAACLFLNGVRLSIR
jgi:hypothetical protein